MSENVTDDRVDPAPGVEVLDAGEAARGFDGLFDRYYARAVRLAYLTGAGDQARAQHIAADALARVWIKWRARTIDDFWPYLRVAVVNELRSNARRARLAERHEQQRRVVVSSPPATTRWSSSATRSRRRSRNCRRGNEPRSSCATSRI